MFSCERLALKRNDEESRQKMPDGSAQRLRERERGDRVYIKRTKFLALKRTIVGLKVK